MLPPPADLQEEGTERILEDRADWFNQRFVLKVLEGGKEAREKNPSEFNS
jgi:hypothetical protein